VYGARSEPGAGHYEMYDEPEYVDAAVERPTDFYVNNLWAYCRLGPPRPRFRRNLLLGHEGVPR
jgi:hypothetical protein